MENSLKKIIWSQLGASIEMLENALLSCPEDVWSTNSKFQDFWYIAFHTLFFLDFYLSESPDNYNPPSPFGLSELDPEGILPERVYTKDELKSYCKHCRNKCKTAIKNLTDEKANQHYKFGSIDLPIIELILYNMRHVQHHTGQLNLILRQNVDLGSVYVKQAKEKLNP